MPYCPECGKEVTEDSEFCPHCGAELPLPESAEGPGEGGIDFSNRILCSDGTCIGVINERGFCNECGKPYKGKAES